jgi:hypothetical protein
MNPQNLYLVGLSVEIKAGGAVWIVFVDLVRVADRVSFEFPFRLFQFRPALLIVPNFLIRMPFPIITDFCMANQFNSLLIRQPSDTLPAE